MTVFWYYRTTNASPLVTPDFLARQKRLLLPGQFAREHQNQWVDAMDAFAIAADVDHAMGQGWLEVMAGRPGVVYVVTVDLGAVHDPTVIVVGHDEGGTAYIDRIITMQGSREAPVQLAAVEAMMTQLASAFAVARVRIESWQGLASAQALGRLGLPVELFTPTAKAHSEEWPVLAQRLAYRRLILPPHARLREELLSLSYEVGSQGVRVVDRGAVHQDHAVAVRMAVASLAGGRADDLGITIGDWGGRLSDLRAGRCGRCGVYHVGACAVPDGVWKPHDYAPSRRELEVPRCSGCGGGLHRVEVCPASLFRRAEITGDRELERELGEGPACKQCGSRHRGAACAARE
jgi:hypothetical protein